VRSAGFRYALQGLLRPLRCISLCSGMLSEAWAALALGLPIDDFVVADTSQKARSFCSTFHRARLSHCFNSMQGLSSHIVAGDCSLHGYCVVDSTEKVDVLCGGPPCQPYSVLRRGSKSPMPEEHRDFNTVFGTAGCPGGSYLEAVRQRRPRGGNRVIMPEPLQSNQCRSYCCSGGGIFFGGCGRVFTISI
jgi:hypothetical protein